MLKLTRLGVRNLPTNAGHTPVIVTRRIDTMARFRATIQGMRGEASRLGSKSSGLVVTANGWNAGITVYVRVDEDGNDHFVVVKLVVRTVVRGPSQSRNSRTPRPKHSTKLRHGNSPQIWRRGTSQTLRQSINSHRSKWDMRYRLAYGSRRKSAKRVAKTWRRILNSGKRRHGFTRRIAI